MSDADMEILLDDIQRIHEDYAFVPPNSNGDITFAPVCRKEIKALLNSVGVGNNKIEVHDVK